MPAVAHHADHRKPAADLTYQWGGMGHDGYQQPPPGGTNLIYAWDGAEDAEWL